jgi:hypothetical protein
MDLNVKLQGLKYNYEKVQGCFCKIPRFQWFLRFMELFSFKKIRRICPRYHGPGPLVPAHGSMDFIKRRSLVTGLTTQIKPIKLESWLLISAVHRRSDGWGSWLRPGVALAHAHGGAAWPSTVAHQSSSFLEPWWSVFYEVCAYAITATRVTCLC